MQNIIYVICVVSLISLGIANFINLEKLKNFVINMNDDLFDPNMSLLTIFVAMIAFSIPFLWNAHQNILDKRKHITGERIENILAQECYRKSIRFFVYFLQVPVGIIVFLGLFIVPTLFPLKIAIAFLMVVFFYFLFLPQIFQMIEDKIPKSLRHFLAHKKATLPDVSKVFKELWQRRDEEIEREFSIKPVHVFDFFSQKIDRLLEKSYLDIAREYFNDFLARIHNRSTFSLAEEIFPKILEWHFKMWRKKVHWWSSQLLSSIIEMIEERALNEDASCLFFPCLKKHWEIHRNEKEYLEHLFVIFYNIFFENIGNIPVRERYHIWESYFPSEWKVTKENLEGENNLISRISLVCFLNWAQERIRQAKEKFDSKLDDVSCNLFPEVEPIIWAKILIFCLKPFGNNRIKDVIEHPCNFGKSRVYRGDGEGEGDLFEAMKSQIKSEKRNTFELTVKLSKYYPLFKDISTEENLKNYIEELEKLEEEYKNDPSKEAKEKESKRSELLRIFNEMRDFLRNREKQVA